MLLTRKNRRNDLASCLGSVSRGSKCTRRCRTPLAQDDRSSVQVAASAARLLGHKKEQTRLTSCQERATRRHFLWKDQYHSSMAT